MFSPYFWKHPYGSTKTIRKPTNICCKKTIIFQRIWGNPYWNFIWGWMESDRKMMGLFGGNQMWSWWWFQPTWKILVKLGIFPKQSKNETCFKPPPSDPSIVVSGWSLELSLSKPCHSCWVGGSALSSTETVICCIWLVGFVMELSKTIWAIQDYKMI